MKIAEKILFELVYIIVISTMTILTIVDYKGAMIVVIVSTILTLLALAIKKLHKGES